MIDNDFGIGKITIDCEARCYCPLGKDWYTNQFTIFLEPDKHIPDYCDIDKFVKSEIENKNFIIEKAVMVLHEYLTMTYEPKSCKVVSYAGDATHSPVTVEKWQ